MHNPKVSFSINENVFNGTARVVDQEKESGLAGEISKLMNTKYKWSQGLIVELTPINLMWPSSSLCQIMKFFLLDPSELSPYIFRSDTVVLVKKKMMKGR
jgi:hypothetical protein